MVLIALTFLHVVSIVTNCTECEVVAGIRHACIESGFVGARFLQLPPQLGQRFLEFCCSFMWHHPLLVAAAHKLAAVKLKKDHRIFNRHCHDVVKHTPVHSNDERHRSSDIIQPGSRQNWHQNMLPLERVYGSQHGVDAREKLLELVGHEHDVAFREHRFQYCNKTRHAHAPE